MFVDPLRDFPLQKINKGHHVRRLDLVDDGKSRWQISILDLYSIYKTALAKVGKLIGLEKLDENRTDLAQLKRTDPTRFERYAARDAEIAVSL